MLLMVPCATSTQSAAVVMQPTVARMYTADATMVAMFPGWAPVCGNGFEVCLSVLGLTTCSATTVGPGDTVGVTVSVSQLWLGTGRQVWAEVRSLGNSTCDLGLVNVTVNLVPQLCNTSVAAFSSTAGSSAYFLANPVTGPFSVPAANTWQLYFDVVPKVTMLFSQLLLSWTTAGTVTLAKVTSVFVAYRTYVGIENNKAEWTQVATCTKDVTLITANDFAGCNSDSTPSVGLKLEAGKRYGFAVVQNSASTPGPRMLRAAAYVEGAPHIDDAAMTIFVGAARNVSWSGGWDASRAAALYGGIRYLPFAPNCAPDPATLACVDIGAPGLTGLAFAVRDENLVVALAPTIALASPPFPGTTVTMTSKELVKNQWGRAVVPNLYFDEYNWNVGQPYTFVPTGNTVEDVQSSVILFETLGTDPRYNATSPVYISIAVNDDEALPQMASETVTGMNATESVLTESAAVTADQQVVVTATIVNPSTPANWSLPTPAPSLVQTVTMSLVARDASSLALQWTTVLAGLQAAGPSAPMVWPSGSGGVVAVAVLASATSTVNAAPATLTASGPPVSLLAFFSLATGALIRTEPIAHGSAAAVAAGLGALVYSPWGSRLGTIELAMRKTNPELFNGTREVSVVALHSANLALSKFSCILPAATCTLVYQVYLDNALAGASGSSTSIVTLIALRNSTDEMIQVTGTPRAAGFRHSPNHTLPAVTPAADAMEEIYLAGSYTSQYLFATPGIADTTNPSIGRAQAWVMRGVVLGTGVSTRTFTSLWCLATAQTLAVDTLIDTAAASDFNLFVAIRFKGVYAPWGVGTAVPRILSFQLKGPATAGPFAQVVLGAPLTNANTRINAIGIGSDEQALYVMFTSSTATAPAYCGDVPAGGSDNTYIAHITGSNTATLTILAGSMRVHGSGTERGLGIAVRLSSIYPVVSLAFPNPASPADDPAPVFLMNRHLLSVPPYGVTRLFLKIYADGARCLNLLSQPKVIGEGLTLATRWQTLNYALVAATFLVYRNLTISAVSTQGGITTTNVTLAAPTSLNLYSGPAATALPLNPLIIYGNMQYSISGPDALMWSITDSILNGTNTQQILLRNISNVVMAAVNLAGPLALAGNGSTSAPYILYQSVFESAWVSVLDPPESIAGPGTYTLTGSSVSVSASPTPITTVTDVTYNFTISFRSTAVGALQWVNVAYSEGFSALTVAPASYKMYFTVVPKRSLLPWAMNGVPIVAGEALGPLNITVSEAPDASRGPLSVLVYSSNPLDPWPLANLTVPVGSLVAVPALFYRPLPWGTGPAWTDTTITLWYNITNPAGSTSSAYYTPVSTLVNGTVSVPLVNGTLIMARRRVTLSAPQTTWPESEFLPVVISLPDGPPRAGDLTATLACTLPCIVLGGPAITLPATNFSGALNSFNVTVSPGAASVTVRLAFVSNTLGLANITLSSLSDGTSGSEVAYFDYDPADPPLWGPVSVTANPPNITAVAPSTVPTCKGVTITVFGFNLRNASAVTFGGAAAVPCAGAVTSDAVNGSFAICSLSPASVAGGVRVVQFNRFTGLNLTLTSAGATLSVWAPPTVASFTPLEVSGFNSTVLTILGTGFLGLNNVSAPAVFVAGALPCAVQTYNNTAIACLSPTPAAASTGNAVTVMAPNDNCNATAAGTLNFTGPPAAPGPVTCSLTATPGVVSVTASAPPSPGASYPIVNYQLSVSPVGGTSLLGPALPALVTLPVGATSTLSVSAINSIGIGAPSVGTNCTTFAAPSLASISPTLVPAGGGLTLTLFGNNFAAPMSVTFRGSIACAGTVAVVSATVATCLSTPVLPTFVSSVANVTVTIGAVIDNTAPLLPNATVVPPRTGNITSVSAGVIPWGTSGMPLVVAVSGPPVLGGSLIVTLVSSLPGTVFSPSAVLQFNSSTGLSLAASVSWPAGVAGTGTIQALLSSVPAATQETSFWSTLVPLSRTVVEPAPTITGLAPSALAPCGGGAPGAPLVTLTGSNFAGAVTVTLTSGPSSFACTAATVVSPTTITCVPPAALPPSGTFAVSVTLALVLSNVTLTGPSSLATAAAPSLLAVLPSRLPRQNASVFITGANLAGVAVPGAPPLSASLGGIPCAVTAAASNATHVACITSITGPATPITGPVTLTTADGCVLAQPLALSWMAPANLSAVAASCAPGSQGPGSLSVTLPAGAVSASDNVVSYSVIAGATPAASFSALPAEITVPPNSNITVTVTAVNDVGAGEPTAPVVCRASVPCTVLAVSPQVLDPLGGTVVTLSGTFLDLLPAPVSVSIGGPLSLCVVVSVTAATLTCTGPAALGNITTGVPYDVLVAGATGAPVSVKFGAFPAPAPVAGQPSILAVSPQTGSTVGGQTISLTGADLDLCKAVMIVLSPTSSVPCAPMAVVSSALITCTTPALPAQRVTFAAVQRSGGANVPGDRSAVFTAVSPPPVVRNVAPLVVSVAGGTVITVTGQNFGVSSSAVSVEVAGAPCSSVQVVSPSVLTCAVGPDTLASVTVNMPVAVTVLGQRSPVVTLDAISGSAEGLYYGVACVPDCRPNVLCRKALCSACARGWASATAGALTCDVPALSARLAPGVPAYTTEAGAETQVVLSRAASGGADDLTALTVTLSVSEPSEAEVTPASVSLPAGASVTVTVRGLADKLRDGDRPYDVQFALSALTLGSLDPLALRNNDSGPVITSIAPKVIPRAGGPCNITVENLDADFSVSIGGVTFAANSTWAGPESTVAWITSGQCPPSPADGYREIAVTNKQAGGSGSAPRLAYYTDDCPDAGFYGRGAQCRQCPVGATCPGGFRLWPSPGFWNSDESDPDIAKCEPEEACLGSDASGHSRCALGYEGFKCSACSAGYIKGIGGFCELCPPPSSSKLNLVVDVIVWTSFALVVVGVSDRMTLSYCIDIIRALQLLGGIGQMSSGRMPSWAAMMYKILHLFSGDYSFIRTSCNGKTPYPVTFGISVVYCAGIITPSFLMCAIASVVVPAFVRARGRGENPEARANLLRSFYRDRFRRTVIIWFAIIYLTLTTLSIATLSCVQVAPGDYRMITDVNTPCYGKNLGVTIASVLILVCLTLGFPIIMIFFMTRPTNRVLLHDSNRFMERYNFLYQFLNRQHPFFWIAEFPCMIVIAAGKSVLRPHVKIQMALCCVIFGAKLAYIIVRRPFIDALTDLAQAFITIISIIAINQNFLARIGLTRKVPAMQTWLLITIAVLVGINVVILLAIVIHRTIKKPVSDSDILATDYFSSDKAVDELVVDDDDVVAVIASANALQRAEEDMDEWRNNEEARLVVDRDEAARRAEDEERLVKGRSIFADMALLPSRTSAFFVGLFSKMFAKEASEDGTTADLPPPPLQPSLQPEEEILEAPEGPPPLIRAK